MITMIIKVLFAQVLSPITSQVLGNATIEVTKNKETITGLKVRGISTRAAAMNLREVFTITESTFKNLLRHYTILNRRYHYHNQ